MLSCFYVKDNAIDNCIPLSFNSSTSIDPHYLRLVNMIALSFFALFLVTVSGYQVATRSRSLTMMSEKSKALPFLKKPAKLDGTAAGDFGFDPLGFTDMFSMNYIKSSELKHARVAMLATVGFLVQQNFHFLTTESNPFKQVAELGFGKNLQILSFIGVIELATWTKSYMSGGNTNS
jgi:hypothetical protein